VRAAVAAGRRLIHVAALQAVNAARDAANRIDAPGVQVTIYVDAFDPKSTKQQDYLAIAQEDIRQRYGDDSSITVTQGLPARFRTAGSSGGHEADIRDFRSANSNDSNCLTRHLFSLWIRRVLVRSQKGQLKAR